MPLHTGHNLRTRKTKKESKKRTSSTVSSSSPTISQTGRTGSPKTTETASSPTERSNGSKSALKPPAASEVAPDKPAEPAKSVPNVFEFLDDSDESSSDSSSDDGEPASSVEARAITKIQSPKPRASPIPHALLASANTPSKSIVTSSPAPSRSSSDSRPPPAAPAPASTEKQLQVARKQPPSRKMSPVEDIPPEQHQLQLTRPESYYVSRDAASIHRPPLPPSPPSSPEDSIHRGTSVRRRDSSALQSTSGYGLLATHLTHSAGEEKVGFAPLYRRFESVNHRVLLHLQDEISQMEEDLNTLDKYEEMHRVATAKQEGTQPLPASRRVDVQSQAYSSLHYRRMDVMAALIEKTEQYNNALSAYSKVLQTLPQASGEDVQNYRTWMKANTPIAAAESRFLDQDADLVALTPRLAASAAAAPVYMAIIIASGALLLPLLAFSMIAEFSGRLVVVTVTGGAAAAIAANYSAGIEALVDSKDGWRCATLYFGFMTVAAMFIP
ncbi:hypothetical protein N7462_009469 [Penicillium macrosclerotiorum]|uniref:uncharacterized protein n=1 Tax=Penicillium macrosclerotiorum TaxID=303699 RepID=UPI002548A194|nr:uncharacterized protein N7462_009469 [Penicillium macrosclerotiorum]KAJ5674030.1 hypothetical protein N7462_009469 [Penicillium macrosclerotiorum]